MRTLQARWEILSINEHGCGGCLLVRRASCVYQSLSSELVGGAVGMVMSRLAACRAAIGSSHVTRAFLLAAFLIALPPGTVRQRIAEYLARTTSSTHTSAR